MLDYASLSRACQFLCALASHAAKDTREALPGKSIWFEEKLKLPALNTYEFCVFQELVGDMKCRRKFSWSKGAAFSPWC